MIHKHIVLPFVYPLLCSISMLKKHLSDSPQKKVFHVDFFFPPFLSFLSQKTED